jgi:Ca-activated chloride channel homolog
VPVTVRDAKGRLVPTLDQSAFQLFVDGIPFPIQSFWREGGLPLSLAVVLDTSGSMGHRRLARAADAIDEFIGQLGPNDEACLITFGGGEVKRRLAFGADPHVIPAILKTLVGYGVTNLYDVIAAAPQITQGAHNVRRAVLLFTDGVDTASRLSADDARKVLERLSDPLYAFGIEPPPLRTQDQPSYEAVLGRLAEASGGRYIRVGDVALLPQQVRRLRQELTMRYIISLTPSGIGLDKWRRIRVLIKGRYQVTARQGYRGTLP